ncbi:MAG: hypothetical protein ACEQSA_02790 [Weeksellaceae bacterium]
MALIKDELRVRYEALKNVGFTDHTACDKLAAEIEAQDDLYAPDKQFYLNALRNRAEPVTSGFQGL